ncbi:MarR family transcriptional regulator [Fodinicurvata sp. EGI_FJ10296]|uniref:MarR family winged helix-turn-helix transcriptional regulator n=1 Tax=Fodinicurvata sp. EGI_FJ10296 TaxID=3231908 RepID=UPI003451DA60
MDRVDQILSQWREQRPDLNVTPMGTVGRISRVSDIFTASMAVVFARHDINAAAFDVLATLRRAGPPYSRSIGEMVDWMMISSGSTTNRIQRLEASGLIERIVDTRDARRASVRLTDAGLAKIDEVVEDHVANQARLTSCLSDEERHILEGLLKKMEAAADPDSERWSRNYAQDDKLIPTAS